MLFFFYFPFVIFLNMLFFSLIHNIYLLNSVYFILLLFIVIFTLNVFLKLLFHTLIIYIFLLWICFFSHFSLRVPLWQTSQAAAGTRSRDRSRTTCADLCARYVTPAAPTCTRAACVFHRVLGVLRVYGRCGRLQYMVLSLHTLTCAHTVTNHVTPAAPTCTRAACVFHRVLGVLRVHGRCGCVQYMVRMRSLTHSRTHPLQDGSANVFVKV